MVILLFGSKYLLPGEESGYAIHALKNVSKMKIKNMYFAHMLSKFLKRHFCHTFISELFVMVLYSPLQHLSCPSLCKDVL